MGSGYMAPYILNFAIRLRWGELQTPQLLRLPRRAPGVNEQEAVWVPETVQML